jgi:hypothetical protein
LSSAGRRFSRYLASWSVGKDKGNKEILRLWRRMTTKRRNKNNSRSLRDDKQKGKDKGKSKKEWGLFPKIDVADFGHWLAEEGGAEALEFFYGVGGVEGDCRLQVRGCGLQVVESCVEVGGYGLGGCLG